MLDGFRFAELKLLKFLPSFFVLTLMFCGFASSTFAQGASELQQGVTLFNQKQYEAAMPLFTRAAQQGNVRATYYLGLCHQQLRHDDRAIELFKHIKTNFPKSDEAQYCNAFLEKLPASAAVTVAPKTDLDKLKAKVEQLSAAQWKALPDTARIPFQMKTGHMYVQAKVNGRYCDIVFDTGASACVMSLHEYPDLFSAADIEKAPSVPVARPHGVVAMKVVSGEVTVDRVTRKLTILLTREPGVSVIGQNFFKEYSYEIDGFYIRLTKAPYSSPIAEADNKPASRPSVNATSTVSAAPGKTAKVDKYSVPFKREGNVMLVDLLVNGRSTKAIFDTGCAPDGVVMPMNLVEKLGIQSNSDGYFAENVEIGPITRKYARVHFANGLHELLIGPKFFGDRRYIVDPSSNLIKFQY